MGDDEAVDDAEQKLAVAQQGDGPMGVVAGVEQGEAVEHQHEGGSQPIMTLQQHGEAEQAARNHGYAEVE